MPTTMVKQINGTEYNVMNLQGSPYAPVNQRVEAATKAGGYTVLSCEFKEVFQRQVCEVWIEYEGRRYPGTAEIKKDFSRPLEDAQTSAIGRALGFAGFDISRAIASAEDMASLEHASVTVESEAPRQLPQRTQPPKVVAKALPTPKTADDPRLALGKLAREIGYDEDGFRDLLQQHTHDGRVQIADVKAQLEREKAQAAS